MSKANHKRESKRNPVLTDDEQSRDDAGGSVLSHCLVRIQTACMQDFQEVLLELCAHVENETDMFWLQGDENLPNIVARLETSLAWIVADAEELEENGGEIRSYEAGLEFVIELAMAVLFEPKANNASQMGNACDLSDLVRKIQSCLIALIARGDVQKAFDLARLAGACRWVQRYMNEEKFVRPGARNDLSSHPNKLKLLVELARWLKQGRIPTHKALRIAVFPAGKDPGDFNDLLKGMRIHAELPKESTGRGNPEKGSLHPGQVIKVEKAMSERTASPDFVKFSDVQEEIAEKIGTVTLTAQQSLQPSGDPLLVDSEVRRIKESLGPVYSLLLIQFGMGEIEEAEKLELFVKHLDDLGLKFK